MQAFQGGWQIVEVDSFYLAIAAALAVKGVENAMDKITSVQGIAIFFGVGQGLESKNLIGEKKKGAAGIAFQLGNRKSVCHAKATVQKIQRFEVIEMALVGTGWLQAGALICDSQSSEQMF